MSDLSEATAQANSEAFNTFIQFQLERYKQWQSEASEGFAHISRRYLIPLKTAVDMYDWTAHQIAQDPLTVYDKKIKPSKLRVIKTATKRIISAS